MAYVYTLFSYIGHHPVYLILIDILMVTEDGCIVV